MAHDSIQPLDSGFDVLLLRAGKSFRLRVTIIISGRWRQPNCSSSEDLDAPVSWTLSTSKPKFRAILAPSSLKSSSRKKRMRLYCAQAVSLVARASIRKPLPNGFRRPFLLSCEARLYFFCVAPVIFEGVPKLFLREPMIAACSRSKLSPTPRQVAIISHTSSPVPDTTARGPAGPVLRTTPGTLPSDGRLSRDVTLPL